jgi:hypothetical protein
MTSQIAYVLDEIVQGSLLATAAYASRQSLGPF